MIAIFLDSREKYRMSNLKWMLGLSACAYLMDAFLVWHWLNFNPIIQSMWGSPQDWYLQKFRPEAAYLWNLHLHGCLIPLIFTLTTIFLPITCVILRVWAKDDAQWIFRISMAMQIVLFLIVVITPFLLMLRPLF